MKPLASVAMAMSLMLVAGLTGSPAHAQNIDPEGAYTNRGVAQERNYGEPPSAMQIYGYEIQASDGEDKDKMYRYDMYTSIQVQYWSRVVDGMWQTFSPHSNDVMELNSGTNILNFIERHRISINEQEAKIICLLVKQEEGDDVNERAPSIIPNWSSWPDCGGVLDVMFGKDFASYAQQKSDDGDWARLQIYQYLLSAMGIHPLSIEQTVNRMVGQGADEDILYTEMDALEGSSCSEPSNNIRQYNIGDCGVMCTVTRIIMGLLNAASQAIVDATVGNPTFKSTILAALTLYVTIYGAMVVLGLVNVALGDAVVRVAKLGVVAMVLSSETVMTLFHMARCFFIEGTTYLINAVLGIGVTAVAELGSSGSQYVLESIYDPSVGGGTDICGASFSDEGSAQGPLIVLEALVAQVFSAHMAMVMLTLVLSEVYGIILGIFLLMGLFGFVWALLGAVTIYLTSLIAQYLLLSVLPIFVAFLLFERTKSLFEGWINQLVTFSLTPIFLFAYISLFVVVVAAALAQILDVRICYDVWLEVPWVFEIHRPYFKEWGSNVNMEVLPFGFFEVLIFVMLVFLMKEFQNTVTQVAQDIGQSFVFPATISQQLQRSISEGVKKLVGKAPQPEKVAEAGLTAARGGVGHGTQSASRQRGVGGVGGAAENVRNIVSRKGPGR